jgi:putative redox protein
LKVQECKVESFSGKFNVRIAPKSASDAQLELLNCNFSTFNFALSNFQLTLKAMRDVVVTTVSERGIAVQVEVGPHRLKGDEPADAGGTDTGPRPHELLLASLGACTAITLRLYAERKGWPLDGVRVRLTGLRTEAHYAIQCDLTLEGPLGGDQRRRLLEIADRCPVHRTLTGTVVISTREASPQTRA